MNVSAQRIFLIILATLLLVSASGCTDRSSEKAKLMRGDQFDGVRTLIYKTMETKNIASLAVAVAKDGKIIWDEGFGWADREKKIKATPDTIYPLASISKMMTATGLMTLVERRLVDLDTPANDYLGPAKLVAYVGKDSDATVRRLLQHTAGLPMHWNIFFENEKNHPPDIDESIRRYGILVNGPGEAFDYSNFGYGVIDHIISQVSKKSYLDFMKSEIFEPLGMTHTSVLIDPILKEHVAQLYDGQQVKVPYWDCDHRGASAIYSSAHDLVRFGMFHLKDHLSDQRQILSDASVDAMHRPTGVKIPDVEIGTAEMGLGCSIVDLHGYRFIGHTGGAPGTTTRLGLVPSEDLAVVILSNSGLSEAYDLYDIEWAIFAALIPQLPRYIDIQLKRPKPYSDPEELRGEWNGIIKTYMGSLPVRMSFKKNEGVILEINGRSVRPIDVANPLGMLSYNDGIFQGPFFGGISTDDTKRASHVLFLHLKLRDNKLNGYAAAISIDTRFCLPNWIELNKKID